MQPIIGLVLLAGVSAKRPFSTPPFCEWTVEYQTGPSKELQSSVLEQGVF